MMPSTTSWLTPAPPWICKGMRKQPKTFSTVRSGQLSRTAEQCRCKAGGPAPHPGSRQHHCGSAKHEQTATMVCSGQLSSACAVRWPGTLSQLTPAPPWTCKHAGDQWTAADTETNLGVNTCSRRTALWCCVQNRAYLPTCKNDTQPTTPVILKPAAFHAPGWQRQ
jgi:hypothetical protein